MSFLCACKSTKKSWETSDYDHIFHCLMLLRSFHVYIHISSRYMGLLFPRPGTVVPSIWYPCSRPVGNRGTRRFPWCRNCTANLSTVQNPTYMWCFPCFLIMTVPRNNLNIQAVDNGHLLMNRTNLVAENIIPAQSICVCAEIYLPLHANHVFVQWNP